MICLLVLLLVTSIDISAMLQKKFTNLIALPCNGQMKRISTVRVAQIHIGAVFHEQFDQAQIGRSHCIDQR